MYSVVLMAALAGAPTSTGHWFSHCHGCHGCHGCYGCHGCWGHTTHYAGNFCHGCQGGYASDGCIGSYYGYHSGFSVYAPLPCSGVFGCTGCYGCYGGWSCYGVALPHHGYWHECEYGQPLPEKKGKDNIEETPAPREKKNLEEEARARVIIDVPADAKVYIDGQLMKTTSSKRAFRTPALVPGNTYFYDLRVEVVRDGRAVVETQRVLLTPGQVITAAFPNLRDNGTATARNDR